MVKMKNMEKLELEVDYADDGYLVTINPTRLKTIISRL